MQHSFLLGVEQQPAEMGGGGSKKDLLSVGECESISLWAALNQVRGRFAIVSNLYSLPLEEKRAGERKLGGSQKERFC